LVSIALFSFGYKKKLFINEFKQLYFAFVLLILLIMSVQQLDALSASNLKG